MDTSNIGNKIKAKRQQLNMTQKDLAKAMNISNQLVSKWETGESVPSLDYLDQLCQTLKTDITYFVSAKKTKQKNRNPLVTKIVALVVALFIGVVGLTFECLVINFTIIPAACKNHYLDNIEESINKTLSLGYYNVEAVGKLDNDVKVEEFNQGYIDDDGNPVYYNSETGVTVKDNIKTYDHDGYFKYEFTNPDNITTLEELFDNQFSSEDSDVSLEYDDIQYIRKSSYGYYIEMKEGVWRDELTNTQKKNYKLTHKITCKVNIKKGYFQSMEMTVKYKDKPSNEHFTITSTVTLKQEKPDIQHENINEKIFNVTRPELTETQFLSNFTETGKTNLSDNFIQGMNQNGLQSFENYLYTNYNDDIYVYNTKTNQMMDNLDADVKKALKYNRVYRSNGIVYAVSDHFSILNPDDLSVLDYYYSCPLQPSSYVYNNQMFQVYCKPTSADTRICFSYRDLYSTDTFHGKEILLTNPATIDEANEIIANFGGKYMYLYYPKENIGIVMDLDTKDFVLKEEGIKPIYVDANNNIYYKKVNLEECKIYIYNSPNVLNGYDIYKEENGYIYTKTDTIIFKYKNNELIETSTWSAAESNANYTVVENKYYHLKGDAVYDIGTNNSRKFINVVINDKSYINFKIIGYYNNHWLVGQPSYNNTFNRIFCYELNNFSKPTAFSISFSNFIKVYYSSNFTILAIGRGSSVYNYYILKN